MKGFIQAFVVALVVVSIGACGGSQTARTKPGDMPQWVKGTSNKYPLSQYVIGIGQAEQLDEAKDRARADLAKTFEVAVMERSSDYQQYLQTLSGGQSKTESTLKIERNVMTFTRKVLRGVEIAEVWHDEASKTYYALAVLSRKRAQNMFMEDIKRLDNATETYIKQAAGSKDKLTKVAYARQALEAQIERAGIQRSLQVVDKRGFGSKTQWTLADLESDLLELLGRIRVRVEVTPDTDSKTRELIANSLAEAGMKVVNEGAVDYVVKGQLTVESLGQRDGWYWHRGTLLIELTDANGKARGSRSWAIKEAATDASLAKRRVNDKVTAVLDSQLLATLLNFVMEKSAR